MAANSLGTAVVGGAITSILLVLVLQLLVGGGLKFMWALLNTIQIVSFIPLMGIRPPPFVLVFFSNLNFVNIQIPIVCGNVREKFLFVRTYEGWQKNFNLFETFLGILDLSTAVLIVFIVLICLLIIFVMVLFIRKK